MPCGINESSDMAEPAPPPPPQTKPARRRLLLLAVTLVFAIAGAAAALRWYYVGQYRTSTDDAYVGGNMVQITPQMEGTVIAIHADETDAVRQGEVLMQLGERVTAGDRLMAVVPLEHGWVDANFKEDEIAAVRIGQPVTLTADLYGGDVVFHGRVQGIGAGTGASFALLQPQNASGNWIKIVQRVPVRIALDTQELAAHPLRIGLSMRAIIDTHRRDGAVLTSTAAAARAETTPVYTAPDTDIDRIIIDIVRANAPPAAERPPR